jgi:Putative prokaryotic signal transducing protein
MWTCAKCGERVDDDFEVCWSCGTSMDGVEDPGFYTADDVKAQPALPSAEESAHLVTVTSCSKPAEALAIRLQLEAAGVPVFLADEFTISMDWLLSNAIGGIKVQVAEADVPRACEVLGLELPAEEGSDLEEGDDTDDADEEYEEDRTDGDAEAEDDEPAEGDAEAQDDAQEREND